MSDSKKSKRIVKDGLFSDSKDIVENVQHTDEQSQNNNVVSSSEKTRKDNSIAISILLGSFLVSLSIILTGSGITQNIVTNKSFKFWENPLPTANTNTDKESAKAKETYTISVDDDPVLGNKDAAITIVEFSDFDCPFCKKSYDEAYKTIKKELVDAGKVKFVFRDLPLTQLHPLAFEKALAGNCAREQGGDSVFFKFHDAVFDVSQSMTQGGKPTDKEALVKISENLGLNTTQFRNCIDTQKYKDEVNKDIQDAEKIAESLPRGGIGTPTYFIGKSTATGSIEAEVIAGAYPYSEFTKVISEL